MADEGTDQDDVNVVDVAADLEPDEVVMEKEGDGGEENGGHADEGEVNDGGFDVGEVGAK